MDQTLTSDPAVAARRTPTRRRLVKGAVALVLIAGLAWAGWWWTHPQFFDSGLDSVTTPPRPVDDSVYTFGVTNPVTSGDHTGSLALRSATAVVARGSATTKVVVCHLVPGGSPLGSARGDVSEYCTSVEPVRPGTTLHQARWSDERRDQLLLVVTPTAPGNVVVTGVRLDYTLDSDHLWRRGSQLLDGWLVVRAR